MSYFSKGPTNLPRFNPFQRQRQGQGQSPYSQDQFNFSGLQPRSTSNYFQDFRGITNAFGNLTGYNSQNNSLGLNSVFGNPVPQYNNNFFFPNINPVDFFPQLQPVSRNILQQTSFYNQPLGRGLTIGDQADLFKDPNIIKSDLDASNGTVQVVDRVLVTEDVNDVFEGLASSTPKPNLAELLTTLSGGGQLDNKLNDDFDILLKLAVDTDLAGVLADEDQNLTVFAPTDGAFRQLALDIKQFLTSNNIDLGINLNINDNNGKTRDENTLDIISQVVLAAAGGNAQAANNIIKDILLIHIKDGKFDIETLKGLLGQSLNTLGKDDLTIRNSYGFYNF